MVGILDPCDPCKPCQRGLPRKFADCVSVCHNKYAILVKGEYPENLQVVCLCVIMNKRSFETFMCLDFVLYQNASRRSCFRFFFLSGSL